MSKVVLALKLLRGLNIFLAILALVKGEPVFVLVNPGSLEHITAKKKKKRKRVSVNMKKKKVEGETSSLSEELLVF